MAEKNSFANLTEEIDKLKQKRHLRQYFYPLTYELIQHGKHFRGGIVFASLLQFLTVFYLMVNITDWISLSSWLLTPVKFLITYTNTDFLYARWISHTVQTGTTIVFAIYTILSLSWLIILILIKPGAKSLVVWHKSLAFNLIVLWPILSAWANIGFLQELTCNGYISLSNCLEPPFVIGWVFALSGVIAQIIVFLFIWNFLYIDSEIMNYSLNGRSKFVTIIVDIERFAITLFSVFSGLDGYQTVLMAALLVSYCVKLFLRLRAMQFYDYKLTKLCLFLDTVILSLTFMNILLSFDQMSISAESIFVAFCIAGVIGSYYVVHFYCSHMISMFKWSNDHIIDGKTLAKQVSSFILLVKNYKTSTQMRLKLWNFMHQHKVKCSRQSCMCHDIPLEHITSGLGEYLVDKGLYEFLADRIKSYIDEQELRMDLQLACAMILLFKLKRFNTVTLMMKQIKAMKATSTQSFEVFILE